MSLSPCPVCARHVRVTESRCVFCSHLLAGGLCFAVALSSGCKGQGANTAAPPSSVSTLEPAASTQPEAGPSASPVESLAPASASAERPPSPPADSLGLGNIGSIGVYGPPPQTDGGVPNTRMVLSRAQFTGPAVPEADAVLGAAMPEFRRCYLRELQKKPAMSGTISVTVELGKGGEITSVNSQRSGTLSEGVRTCTAARISALKFQPPEGGQPSVLQFTIKCEAQPR